MAKKADSRTGSRHKGVPRSFRFTEEQDALLKEAKAKHGGTFADTVGAALRAYLGRNDITQSEVIAWIEDHTK